MVPIRVGPAHLAHLDGLIYSWLFKTLFCTIYCIVYNWSLNMGVRVGKLLDSLTKLFIIFISVFFKFEKSYNICTVVIHIVISL